MKRFFIAVIVLFVIGAGLTAKYDNKVEKKVSKPITGVQSLLISQPNTAAGIAADTLNPNPTFNGSTGWYLPAADGTSYVTTESSDPGTGSIYIVPARPDSYYLSGELVGGVPQYSGHLALLQSNPIAVTPGEEVTVSADSMSKVWPPNELLVGLLGSGPGISERYLQPREFPFGVENGAAAPQKINEWSSSAKTIPIPTNINSVRLQIYTYSKRPIYLDNVRIVRGAERIVPSVTPKQSFNGSRMTIDPNGNIKLYNPITNVLEPRFPLANHGWFSNTYYRPNTSYPAPPTASYISGSGVPGTYSGFLSVARMAAMKAAGWDINVWGAGDLGQLQNVAQGGMQAMFQMSGVICRTWGAGDCPGSLNTIASMTSLMNTYRASTTPYSNGISVDEALVGGWLDNENYGSAWQNVVNVVTAWRAADQNKGPVLMLHTSSGAGIGAWNKSNGDPISDMTGVYIDPANNLRLSNMMGVKSPARLCQINFSLGFRSAIGQCLAAGGKMAIYFGDGPADGCCLEPFFENYVWAHDLPQLRSDLNALTSVIQSTDIPLGAFEIQNTAVTTNAGKNQVSPLIGGMKEYNGTRYMFFGNSSNSTVNRRIKLASGFPYQVSNVYNTLTGALVATVPAGQDYFDISVTGYGANANTGGMLVLTLEPSGGVPPSTTPTTIASTTTKVTIPGTVPVIINNGNTSTLDDSSPAWVWNTETSSEATGWVKYGPGLPAAVGDYLTGNHTTSLTGASVNISFTGSNFKLYGAKGTVYGKFTVSIDGGAAVLVDTNDTVNARQELLYSRVGLSAGSHTATIVVQSSPSLKYVVLDKVEVSPSDGSLTCYNDLPTMGVGFTGGWQTPASETFISTIDVSTAAGLKAALNGTLGAGQRLRLAPGTYTGIFNASANIAGIDGQPAIIEGNNATIVGRLDLSSGKNIVVRNMRFSSTTISGNVVNGSNVVTVASTATLEPGLSVEATGKFPVNPTVSLKIGSILNGTSFTVLDQDGNIVNNTGSTGSTDVIISAVDALTVAAPAKPVGSGSNIRITNNVFEDVGSGATGSASGIIKADHPAKGRVGGWDPATIASNQGVDINQVYTIGLGLGSAETLPGYTPMADLNLVVDNNTFTRNRNPVLWVSGGFKGTTFARNMLQGTTSLHGSSEQELVKVGFGWPQSIQDHNINVMNNTFAASLTPASNPYIAGFKDPGTLFAYNQISTPNSRVSFRNTHGTMLSNVFLDGRILVGGTDINSDGNIDAASLIEGNWIASITPSFDAPNIVIAGRATSGANYDGSGAKKPNYSIQGSTDSVPAVIRNNAFYLRSAAGNGAITGFDYQGDATVRPSGVQWTNNYFEKTANLGYIIAASPFYQDTVAAGVWSSNRFHGHTGGADDDSGTFIPAGALAGGGVKAALTCEGSVPTTTVATTTTIPGPTTTTTTTTTTTIAPTRVVTLRAFVDSNGNGVLNVGEPVQKNVKYRLYNPSGVQVSGGTLTFNPGTLTVPTGAGWKIYWYPLLKATTPTVVNIPASGPATIVVGGCCVTSVTKVG